MTPCKRGHSANWIAQTRQGNRYCRVCQSERLALWYFKRNVERKVQREQDRQASVAWTAERLRRWSPDKFYGAWVNLKGDRYDSTAGI